MLKKNVYFKKFIRLVPYLKKLSVGSHPKVSKVLEEVNQFIREADDETYLMVKVVLILGISDACRLEELTVGDMEDKDSILIVKVPDTKTNIQRIFTVSNLDYIDIYRKYAALPDSGATIDVLKRHGGWKSSNVVEGYVESSIKNKQNISDKIFGQVADLSFMDVRSSSSLSPSVSAALSEQTSGQYENDVSGRNKYLY
ncbi:hypothetical protein NQ317_016468 [Molorchus minor]|uniref:Tyr recombinase domain-containing protein n=1 Tax=Molorchus minor TaxID=1323400 RepID=A0ABQ9JQP5_9CUCU|nr:hypothetical protein NQ317_016468 [Molorchus minor]